MALLTRYRRSGGFEQLLKLIETSTQTKRSQLLELIEKEDASWAKLIVAKALSVERIFSWDVSFVKDIVNGIEPRVLGISVSKLSPGLHDKLASCMTNVKWAEVEDHIHARQYSEGEVHAASIRIILHTRKLEEQAYFRFQDIDPSLVLAAS